MSEKPSSGRGRTEPSTSEPITSENDNKYLIFYLGKQLFGTHILGVKEVLKPIVPTPVTSDIPFFKGAINLRGEVIGVVDLREMFRAEEVDTNECSYLVFDSEKGTLGGIVDQVYSVLTIEPEEIQQTYGVDGNSMVKSGAVKGLVRSNNNLITILHLAALVDVDVPIDLPDAT